MFSHIKSQIKELAKNAVLAAENQIGKGNGQEKKEMAVNYIVKNLPFSNFTKHLISIFLARFIDDVIEVSVIWLKSLQEEKGD